MRRRLIEAAALAARRFAVRRARHDVESALHSARRVMRSKRYCVLVTTGENGPDACTMQPFRPDEQFRVRLGTSPTSRKAAQIAATGRVLLVYENDRDGACVVAHCAARVSSDADDRRRWFMPVWRAFWPGGSTDPFVVIECVPDVLEVWDGRRAITPPPFGLRAARLERRDGTWTLS